MWVCAKNVPSFLMNEDGLCKTYGHYDRILRALRAIEDKEWTPEINLRSTWPRDKAELFILDSHDWRLVRDRVKAVGFRHILSLDADGRNCRYAPFFSQDWFQRFMKDCRNIESVTLDDERDFVWFFRLPKFEKLRRLTIRNCALPCQVFPQFLENHATTLESVRMECVLLSRYNYIVGSDRGNEDEGPNWISISQIMLNMPQLEVIRLSDLEQDFTGAMEPRKLLWNHADAQDVPDICSIAVQGQEIGVRLRRTIEEATMIEVEIKATWDLAQRKTMAFPGAI
jgi:hypothetical protein